MTEKSCLRQLEFCACSNIFYQWDSFVRRAVCYIVGWIILIQDCWNSMLDQWDCRLFFQARMVCTVCSILWWKRLAQGICNFEFVQIFFCKWMTQFCQAHIVCTLYAVFLDSVLFLDGNFFVEVVLILSLSNYFWAIGLQSVSQECTVCPGCWFFNKNFFLKVVWILSLSKYSWPIGLFCQARMECIVIIFRDRIFLL